MATVVEQAHVAAVLDAARLGIDGIDAHAGLVDLHLAQQRVLTVVRMHAEAAGAGGHDERILLRQRIGVEAAGRDGPRLHGRFPMGQRDARGIHGLAIVLDGARVLLIELQLARHSHVGRHRNGAHVHHAGFLQLVGIDAHSSSHGRVHHVLHALVELFLEPLVQAEPAPDEVRHVVVGLGLELRLDGLIGPHETTIHADGTAYLLNGGRGQHDVGNVGRITPLDVGSHKEIELLVRLDGPVTVGS